MAPRWILELKEQLTAAKTQMRFFIIASLRLLKGGFISHLLDTRIQEKLVLGKRLTVLLANLKVLKIRLSPTTSLVTHRIPVAKTVYVPAAESRLLSACTAP